jgi:hypothetical protein
MRALDVSACTFHLRGEAHEVVTVVLDAPTWHQVESFARPARKSEGYVSHPMYPVTGDWDLEEVLELWVEMYEETEDLRRLWIFRVITGEGDFFGVSPEVIGDNWDLSAFAFSGTITEGVEGEIYFSSELN